MCRYKSSLFYDIHCEQLSRGITFIVLVHLIYFTDRADYYIMILNSLVYLVSLAAVTELSRQVHCHFYRYTIFVLYAVYIQPCSSYIPVFLSLFLVGEGGLPYVKVVDSCQKIRIKALKQTNVGGA